MADLRPQIKKDYQHINATITQCAGTTPQVDDAEELRKRRDNNYNKMRGHAHSTPALAVLYARTYPNDIPLIRQATQLSRSSRLESRYVVWKTVMANTKALLQSQGSDIVSEQVSTSKPQTAQEVAKTYLSTKYGGKLTGSQGGKGDTILKRTLKLIAHCGLPSLGNVRKCC